MKNSDKITIITPLLKSSSELFEYLEQNLNGSLFTHYIIWTPTDIIDEECIKLLQVQYCNLRLILHQVMGIYSALNRFLREFEGNYFIFKGDTDVIYECNLSKIDLLDYDIIVGEVLEKETKKFLKPYKLPIIGFGINFASGVVVKTSTVKRFGFDERLKIAADTKLLCSMLRSGASCYKSPYIYGEFARDGVSSKRYALTVFEHFLALFTSKFYFKSMIFIGPRVLKLIVRLRR